MNPRRLRWLGIPVFAILLAGLMVRQELHVMIVKYLLPSLSAHNFTQNVEPKDQQEFVSTPMSLIQRSFEDHPDADENMPSSSGEEDKIPNQNEIDWSVMVMSARRMVNYEQPSPVLVERISRIYRKEDSQQKSPSGVSGWNVVVVNNVFFYPYWQGEEGEYVFLPMAMGCLFSCLNCSDSPRKYLEAGVTLAHQLPNGGLLWYYPDNYKLNRFLGPDIHPSAISQGQILGGIVHLDKRCNLGLKDLARKVFLGLKFDYYRGGVNLEDRALLELPLFRSAPEIILNGWLHALLYLRQYAEFYQDREAKLLLEANLKFLGRSLKRFHDPKTGLSLYSDLGPYRVKVEPAVDNLIVFYRSRVPEFDDLVFELKVIEHPTRSPYDNQIIRRTKNYIYAQVSCSQHYDTYLLSKQGPFTVTFTTGTYSPKRATPGPGGEKIALHSKQKGNFNVVHLTEVREKLFCGFPTNFLKWGRENYYHVYHIVALTCLLAVEDMKDETSREIFYWIRKWMTTVDRLSAEGYLFTSYDKMLEELRQHGACMVAEDWESLFKKAQKEVPSAKQILYAY